MDDQVRRKFQHAYPLLMLQKEDNSFVRFGLEVGPGWLPLVFEVYHTHSHPRGGFPPVTPTQLVAIDPNPIEFKATRQGSVSA